MITVIMVVVIDIPRAAPLKIEVKINIIKMEIAKNIKKFGINFG